MLFREHTVKGGEALKTSIGTVLAGRYKVRDVVGVGGMAIVYEAEDAILGRTVALKTLRRSYAEEASFRRSFKQEARAMASLDHHNIVKIYDICQGSEGPFIVAEYVGGQDVGGLLSGEQAGSIGERFARRIVAQLLEALSYAHQRGVIHRDIKPSNVLMTEEGIVKVADFGIARIVEDEGAGEPGEIMGSARYMAPEQLIGEDATPRSDIYSVGVLLYHCLTGQPPFSGDLESLTHQKLHKDPTPPRKLNKDISPQLEAVILKALARDPANRHRSADAMLDELGSNLSPEVIGTGGARLTRSQKKDRARWRRLLLASTFVLLLLFGGTALAAGMGYVEVPVDMPTMGNMEEALNRAEPVVGEPIEAPREPAPEPAIPNPQPAPETSTAAAVGSQTVGSQSPAVNLVLVPDVRAYLDYFAEQILRSSGFNVRFVYGEQLGYANRGVAWATDPPVGTLAPAGSTITVYVTPKE